MSTITLLLGLAALASAQATRPTPTPSARSSAARPSPSVTGPPSTAAIEALKLNGMFFTYIIFICGGLVVFFTIYRVTIESTKRVRTLVCLNNETQRYFVTPSPSWAKFKKHLLYAPMFGKRHNREFQLSAAVNVGTLPTRFQFLFLTLYLATNVVFCVYGISFGASFSTVANQLRARTGTLAVVNMMPLLLMAGRTNPLINLLNISFDTFNLLHRWFGRIVVLQGLAHTAAHMASIVNRNGWAAFAKTISDPTILYGSIATGALVIITIQASSIFRHAFYETFKVLHIILAAAALSGIAMHLKLVNAKEMKIFLGVIAMWVVDRLLRMINVLYRNRFGSRALIEALPGGAARVTIDMPRPWKFKPGHHAYLYMPAVGLWQSHPFSVAWSDEVEPLEDEKLKMDRQEILAQQKSSFSYIVRARTGFTKKLIERAEAAPTGRFTTRVFAEGPYGGMHMMHSYGTVMLFAGGIGITHQVPHVRDLVAGFSNGTVAARKVVLVWVIQSPEHLEWIRPWMTSILAMDRRRDVLRIMLFVSRPRSTKEIHSPSSTVQMFPGRPNVETLIDMEMDTQIGAMGVSVCGSGSLSDDVRAAVRARQTRGHLDFVEEAFSW